MPKEKPFKLDLNAFYKAQTEDVAMFAFITGVQHFLPAISTQTLIKSFMEVFGLDEDSYPQQCASSTFTVMQRKFIDLRKTK